jgi:hypothetical protein
MEKWMDLDGKSARVGDDGARFVRNEWYMLDPDDPKRVPVRYIRPGREPNFAVVLTEKDEEFEVEDFRLRLQERS